MNSLVRPARRAKEMTQLALAVKSGVHRSCLACIEQGERCSYSTAMKLARALDTTPEVLFPGEVLNGAPYKSSKKGA